MGFASGSGSWPWTLTPILTQVSQTGFAPSLLQIEVPYFRFPPRPPSIASAPPPSNASLLLTHHSLPFRFLA